MLFRAAGYYLTVTSWENDADNYRTESKHYTDLTKLRNDIKLISLCTSQNNSVSPGIGNTSDNDVSEIIECFYNFVETNPGILPITLEKFENDDDPEQLMYELLDFIPNGLGLKGSEYYLVRVLEKFSIEYFPEDVICEDVTENFI